jgi:hypothetical protein
MRVTYTLLSFIVLVLIVLNNAQSCTNQFGKWIEKTNVPFPHIEGATAVINNKMYIFSGFYTDESYITPINTGGLVCSDRLDIYDPVEDKWTVGATVPFKASHIQAAGWSNPPSGQARYIFIAGGFQGPHPGEPSEKVWRYDTVTDTFSRMADLPEKRASGGFTIDSNHLLHYIAGLKDRENDVTTHWTLDLTDADAKWEDAPEIIETKNHFPAMVVGDIIYATGGQHHHDAVPVDTNLMTGYNFVTKTWKKYSLLPAPRTHVEPASTVINGRICLFGGRNNQGPGPVILSTAVEYNPKLDQWNYLSNMPQQGIAMKLGHFKNIEIDGVKGEYVVLTAGGIDWNIPSFKTYISKVECDCCEVQVEPSPEPQATVVAPSTVDESVALSTQLSQQEPSQSPELHVSNSIEEARDTSASSNITYSTWTITTLIFCVLSIAWKM